MVDDLFMTVVPRLFPNSEALHQSVWCVVEGEQHTKREATVKQLEDHAALFLSFFLSLSLDLLSWREAVTSRVLFTL